jgi:hypothetical protein
MKLKFLDHLPYQTEINKVFLFIKVIHLFFTSSLSSKINYKSIIIIILLTNHKQLIILNGRLD